MAIDTNLKNLGKIISALDEDRLSKEEFSNAVQKLLAYVNKVEMRNIEVLEEIKKKLAQETQRTSTSLRSDLGDAFGEMDSRHQAKLDERAQKMLENLQEKYKEFNQMLDDFKRGEMTERKREAVRILDGVRREISLSKDGTLGKRISDLEEEVKRLKKQKTVVSGGGGIVGRDIVKNYDLSPYLDGATKTFNIPAVWSIISVACSSFPNILRPTIDYTYTPQTITFTSEIDETTTLAAGQTVIITLVSG